MRGMRCLAVIAVLLALLTAGAAAAELGWSEGLFRGCDPYGNTNVETSFGNLAADAARGMGRADAALLPSADFGANLQPGAITEEALALCLQRNSVLAAVTLTPAQLYGLLETGFSRIVLRPDSTVDWEQSRFDGYLQLSGLRVTYDAAAPAGQRVYALSLEGGAPLDRDDHTSTLRMVSTLELLSGGFGYPAFDQAELTVLGTEREAVAAWIQSSGGVIAPSAGRVDIYGSREWTVENRAVIVLALAAACLLLARITRGAKDWGRGRTAGGAAPAGK